MDKLSVVEMLMRMVDSAILCACEEDPKKVPNRLGIEKVVFNYPYTILCFDDGTKEIVKTDGFDAYSPELGVAMAVVKRVFGTRGDFLRFVDNHVKKHKCAECGGMDTSYYYEDETFYCDNEDCPSYGMEQMPKKVDKK